MYYRTGEDLFLKTQCWAIFGKTMYLFLMFLFRKTILKSNYVEINVDLVF